MQLKLVNKKIISMIIIVLISCQDTFGQQNVIIDDKGIGDNLTLIISAILFVIGFIALIILKKREEHKIENEHKTNHLSKHIHHHPNHYGHKHH